MSTALNIVNRVEDAPASAPSECSGTVPVKELTELFDRAEAGAESSVRQYQTTDYHQATYEYGDHKRKKKWEGRLKDIRKIRAWVESQNP